MRLSYTFMLLGVLVMLFGCGTLWTPMSTVEVGPVKISEIDPLSASLIGVGAIIFLAGIGLYLKKK